MTFDYMISSNKIQTWHDWFHKTHIRQIFRHYIVQSKGDYSTNVNHILFHIQGQHLYWAHEHQNIVPIQQLNLMIPISIIGENYSQELAKFGSQSWEIKGWNRDG